MPDAYFGGQGSGRPSGSMPHPAFTGIPGLIREAAGGACAAHAAHRVRTIKTVVQRMVKNMTSSPLVGLLERSP
jgi:hypothetical protein